LDAVYCCSQHHESEGSMTEQNIEQLARHRKVPSWVLKLVADAISHEREACAKIVETYRIPVGNSAAGELACEWTHDALKEILDAIRARGNK